MDLVPKQTILLFIDRPAGNQSQSKFSLPAPCLAPSEPFMFISMYTEGRIDCTRISVESIHPMYTKQPYVFVENRKNKKHGISSKVQNCARGACAFVGMGAISTSFKPVN